MNGNHTGQVNRVERRLSQARRIMLDIGKRFDRELENFRNILGAPTPCLVMENFYSRDGPLELNPFRFLFDYILAHNYDNFLKYGVEQLMNLQLGNLQLGNLQPLKLVYRTKYIIEENGVKVKVNTIDVPLLSNLRNHEGLRIFKIKIRNIITCYDTDNREILNKFDKMIHSEVIDIENKEVTVEELNFNQDNNIAYLHLNVGDSSNEYSYMLLYTVNGIIIEFSEIIQFMEEKQYIQRSAENCYLCKLIENGGLFRFMYYMNTHLINIRRFKEEFRYDLLIRNIEENPIVFNENDYVFGINTETEIVRARLKNLRKLINLFINNNRNDPIPEGNAVVNAIVNPNIQRVQNEFPPVQNGIQLIQNVIPVGNQELIPEYIQPFQNQYIQFPPGIQPNQNDDLLNGNYQYD